MDDEEDTSYFDTRADRYCHDVGEDDTDGDGDGDASTSSTPALFGSFSSWCGLGIPLGIPLGTAPDVSLEI